MKAIVDEIGNVQLKLRSGARLEIIESVRGVSIFVLARNKPIVLRPTGAANRIEIEVIE